MPKRGYNDYIGSCTIGSLQKCEQFDEIVNKHAVDRYLDIVGQLGKDG
jgi:hypothetical protein